MLCQARAHQQPAIGFAQYRELGTRGMPLADEPARCGREIIEHDLPAVPNGGSVPVFSKFTAATNVGNGVYAATLQPGDERGVKSGQDHHTEAAVTVGAGVDSEANDCAISVEIAAAR